MNYSLFLIVGSAFIGVCTNSNWQPHKALHSAGEESKSDGRNQHETDAQNETDIDFDDFDKISKLENVKHTIMGDLSEIYYAARYPEFSSRYQFVVNMTKEDLPKFSDPYEVGNYTEGYILGHINLYNVRVIGLDDWASSKIEIDHKERTATLEIKYDKVIVAGIYSVGSFLQGSHGNFTVTMMPAKYVQITNFTVDPQTGEIHFSKQPTSEFDYLKIVGKYDNLSFIAKIRENAIDSKLVTDVNVKIQQYVDEKLRDFEHLHARMEKLSPKDIATRNIKRYITEIIKNCNPTTLGASRIIEIDGEAFEIMHDDTYVVKVTKMFINDWETFDADHLSILENVDRVRIRSGLTLKKVLVSALVSIRNLKKADEPFKMKHIVYETDYINWITTSAMEKKEDRSEAFVPRKISVSVGDFLLSNENQYDQQAREYMKSTMADELHSHFVDRVIKFSIRETKARVYKRLILPAH